MQVGEGFPLLAAKSHLSSARNPINGVCRDKEEALEKTFGRIQANLIQKCEH